MYQKNIGKFYISNDNLFLATTIFQSYYRYKDSNFISAMILIRKRHKKKQLFYPIGFLSLGLLLLLCLQKLKIEYIECTKPIHCLVLAFPHKQFYEFDTLFTIEGLKKMRIYKNYYLTNTENKLVLHKLKKELNEIKYSKDTVNGIHILLNDFTTYQDFIKLVDISNEHWPPTYGSNEKDFWTFYTNVKDTVLERKWKAKHHVKY
jgi:hypothetical protein